MEFLLCYIWYNTCAMLYYISTNVVLQTDWPLSESLISVNCYMSFIHRTCFWVYLYLFISTSTVSASVILTSCCLFYWNIKQHKREHFPHLNLVTMVEPSLSHVQQWKLFLDADKDKIKSSLYLLEQWDKRTPLCLHLPCSYEYYISRKI